MHPWLALSAASVVAWAICYLVHLPNTKPIRLGLFPLGLWFAFATARESGIWGRKVAQNLTNFMVIWHLGAALRWTLASSPPIYQTPIRPYPYPSLRRSNLFKGLNLLWSEQRHVGIEGFSVPLSKTVRTRRGDIIHHLTYLIFHFVWVDSLTYAIYLFSTSTYNTRAGPWEFRTRCVEYAREYHVPVIVVSKACTILLAFWVYQGMAVVWHMFALVGVSSGIWVGEEWPKFMDKPWMTTSLSDLWGRRWHQAHRDLLLLWAKPLRRWRGLHIIAVFVLSALQHSMMPFIPFGDTSAFFPWFFFFMGNVLGIALERRFYKLTGRKVGGVLGAIWTWTWALTFAGPFTEWMWADVARTDIAGFDPRQSILPWGLHAVGMAARPAVIP